MIRVLCFFQKCFLTLDCFQYLTRVRGLEFKCRTYLFLSVFESNRFDLGTAVRVCSNGFYGIGPIVKF